MIKQTCNTFFVLHQIVLCVSPNRLLYQFFIDAGVIRLSVPFFASAIWWKNFLFADTPKDAHTNARFYSLIETCKLHDHEPYAYLKYIIKELPLATTIKDYEAVLPWNLDVESVRKSREKFSL